MVIEDFAPEQRGISRLQQEFRRIIKTLEMEVTHKDLGAF